MSRYIDAHRDRFGVEPICRVLDEPTSTYYAARTRPPSARKRRDAQLLALIRKVHAENYGVYGARRVWHALLRQGIAVGRPRVERLMAKHGLVGVQRGRKPFTTVPDLLATRPADLVRRDFTASRLGQLWLADITYVRTWEGFCYVAFVLDVFTRRIAGWQLARNLRTDLPLDALEMAAWLDGVTEGLIHHSDAGCQGGFRWSSQHLDREELRWEQAGVVGLIELGVLRCGRQVGRRWDGASMDSGSGRRSLAG